MNNTKININLTPLKFRSSFLALLYILVLGITILHHHPIDLGTKSHSIKNNFDENIVFLYTAKDCPILAFAQNDFNSTDIQIINANSSLYLTTSVLRYTLEIKELNYPQTNYLRGPPFPLV